MLSVHVLVTACAVLTLLFVSVSSFLQCNHSNTVNSCLVDTSLLRTAAKSYAKINYRCLTEINSCYMYVLWALAIKDTNSGSRGCPQ